MEEELFNKYKVDKIKLKEYGFIEEKNILKYKKDIMDNRFTIIIEYEQKIKGKIIEKEFNDEYTNFRRKELGEFNTKIKNEFVNLLIDIRDKCFTKNVFNYDQTKRINKLIINKYNVNPEFLWEKYPSFAIYRKTKKWFALVGNVQLSKIDKKSNSMEEVEIINLKIKEDEKDILLNKKGYHEAYHMNKKNWITIILDDTLSDQEIEKMISNSYNNIKE